MDALVPDDLWAVISPLVRFEPEKLKGGRPRASDRSALAGIILVLRVGMQWKRVLLEQLQDANALNWSRVALDSASVPAKTYGPPRPQVALDALV